MNERGNDLSAERVRAMLTVMVEMQDAHNVAVHPEWRIQGYDYWRAIWVECAELLDHFGWKWWKHQQTDLDQVRLEIVDIWHFALSDLIRGEADWDEVVVALMRDDRGSGAPVSGAETEAFRGAVEALALDVLANRAFRTEPFVQLLHALPLSVSDLFELYVGKNVLNNFRQRNGYKEGTYRKVWQGREDNEHLIDAMQLLDCDPGDMPARLDALLAERYGASAGAATSN